MSFIDDARKFLTPGVAEIRELLDQERYVRRFLYKEGEDPTQVTLLNHLTNSTLTPEDNLLKDDQIMSGRRMVLSLNASRPDSPNRTQLGKVSLLAIGAG